MPKSIMLFLNMSGGEIFIILLFILLFFGAESIPKIARNMGRVINQVRSATDEIKKDIRSSADNIKNDVMDQAGQENPLNDLKKDIDDSIKDIKL